MEWGPTAPTLGMEKTMRYQIKQKSLPAGRQGFTLIELLVVIAVIGILASVVLASLNSARGKARDARRFSDLRQISLALELYYDDYGAYPQLLAYIYPARTDPQDVNWTGALTTALRPYINPVPQDPAGRPYMYSSTNAGQKYGLMTEVESTANYAKSTGDGGFFNNAQYYYEVGSTPSACARNGIDWWGNPAINC